MMIKIAKLIIYLKNSSRINQKMTLVEFSKINILVLNLLYKEGLIQSFSLHKNNKNFFRIAVTLR